VGSGEGIKPQLSQALTRGARPDSNSRAAVQISNPLPSRYAPWGLFWIRGNLTPRKAHFVGPGEGVKLRLSQALTRGARPDSNSRPTMQISNPLPSRYVPWGLLNMLKST